MDDYNLVHILTLMLMILTKEELHQIHKLLKQ